MTTFLFLQKFDEGKLVFMPFQPLIEVLTRYGKLGRGRGDWEITFPPGETAASCTVVGDAEHGILCIGFERPSYNDTLRKIVWECMSQANCTVFDDTLDIVCTCLDARKSLPQSLLDASYSDVREISSELQLWPEGLEFAEQGPDVPVMTYPDPNPNGAGLQYFDHIQPERNMLYINMDILPAACNQGTLRVIYNLELRVDSRGAHPQYGVSYFFAHQESSLSLMGSPRPDIIIDPFASNDAYNLVLKLPRLDKIVNPSVIMQTLFAIPGSSRFYADRELFAQTKSGSMRLKQFVFSTRKLELDDSVNSVPLLSILLDDLHRLYIALPRQLDQENLLTWVYQTGCYLGTMLQFKIGGQWGFIRRNQRKSMAIRLHTGRICHPFLLVLDHIVNGKRSNINAYFAALMRSDMSATEREFDKACNIPGFCQILLGKSQFQSDGLPIENRIPRHQLDYSVASLRHLDTYLDKVILQRDQFSPMCMMNLSVAASAYLGEVIRCNAHDKTEWCWVNYEDFARDNPDFKEKRPYEEALSIFMDSPKQTIYPLHQLVYRLLGMQMDSTFVYGNKALGNEIKEEPPVKPENAAYPFTNEVLSNINLQKCVSTLPGNELDYLNISAVIWDGTSQITRPIIKLDTLLKHGRIVWGYVVQANSDSLKPGKKCAPCVVVYDVTGKQSPEKLAPVASQLFDLARNYQQQNLERDNPQHAEMLSIAQILSAGKAWVYGSKVPQLISDYPLHLATVCIERKHLPGNMLLLPYFPIIISDLCHGSAMILPEKWWPKELLALTNQKFEEYTRTHPAPTEPETKATPVKEDPQLSYKFLVADLKLMLLSLASFALVYHFFSSNMSPLFIALFVMSMFILGALGLLYTYAVLTRLWSLFVKRKSAQ